AAQDYIVGTETNTSITASDLRPISGFDDPPADLDGDGQFKDINGDGNVSISDVQAMFANRDSPVFEDNVGKFDYTGNGQVNIVDVQQLFVEVSN
ncbi:dockerin type I domain-containing protein, partial [Haloferax profundi]